METLSKWLDVDNKALALTDLISSSEKPQKVEIVLSPFLQMMGTKNLKEF